MKKIISLIALIVLLTTTLTSQVSNFNYILWDIVTDDNPENRISYQDKAGKAYHTYKPDSVIKDPTFYGEECIIFVYDNRKDNVDFFPITHKEYTDDGVIYYCYNAKVKLRIIYNEKANNYMMAWYSTELKGYAEASYISEI